ncbi:Ig-like domain-containing protein [Sphingomonas aurantiaca]|uniref:Ig-like domain-containing protein n=1 Tax=Sphingomonas aurantiaca TaxID=185949 RepID=UPI002FE1EA33
MLARDPSHQFVVNGDFNGFYYETALQTLAPAGNSGALSNLIYKLPVEERYTYYFDGYYQSFDNVIVSTGLYAESSFDIVHYNAGYNDGLSTTDHDQALALIGIARTGTGPAVAVADGFAITAISIYGGTVLANDTGGDPSLGVIALNGSASGVDHSVRLSSGALVTLLSGGTFSYNPDGAFSALAAGATTTDSFTYTISGGSTATATVTITGIATLRPTVPAISPGPPATTAMAARKVPIISTCRTGRRSREWRRRRGCRLLRGRADRRGPHQRRFGHRSGRHSG